MTTYKGNAIIIYMKDKQMIVLVDDEFLGKVDYIQRINDYKSKSETIRKTVEKEWRKEATLEGLFVDIDCLIRAFKKRWRESENQSMTYPEIISFIRDTVGEK